MSSRLGFAPIGVSLQLDAFSLITNPLSVRCGEVLPCPEEAPGLSPGVNGAKLSSLWGDLLPRRGYTTQPRVEWH
jgi:hypothetical protein